MDLEQSECSACVELKIPCRPEYVGVTRLTILGVASRMKFSYDDVEDIRLAVGEACTTSVDWAEKNNITNAHITLNSEISANKLTIDIIDEAGPRIVGEMDVDEEIEPENIGALLVTLLVDEVEVFRLDKGTHVRMVKYARN